MTPTNIAVIIQTGRAHVTPDQISGGAGMELLTGVILVGEASAGFSGETVRGPRQVPARATVLAAIVDLMLMTAGHSEVDSSVKVDPPTRGVLEVLSLCN